MAAAEASENQDDITRELKRAVAFLEAVERDQFREVCEHKFARILKLTDSTAEKKQRERPLPPPAAYRTHEARVALRALRQSLKQQLWHEEDQDMSNRAGKVVQHASRARNGSLVRGELDISTMLQPKIDPRIPEPEIFVTESQRIAVLRRRHVNGQDLYHPDDKDLTAPPPPRRRAIPTPQPQPLRRAA